MSETLQEKLAKAKARQQAEIDANTQEIQIALEQQKSDLIAFAKQSQSTIKTTISDLYNPSDLTAPIQDCNKEMQDQIKALKTNLNQSLQSLADISQQWVETQVQPSKTNELLQDKITEIMEQLEQSLTQTLADHQARTKQQMQKAMSTQYKDFSEALQQIVDNHNSIQQDILQIKHQSEALKNQMENAYQLMAMSNTLQTLVLKYPNWAAILLIVLALSLLILFFALFVTLPFLW